MDWTTLLRSLQSDFIARLKSGCLLHCETEGQYSELTVISGERLNQLREFCWQMAEKYKRTSLVRDVFINNLKGKLGEEVVKARLTDFINEVDYEKRFGGDGKIDFTLTCDPTIGIEVKVRQGSFDKVRWSVSVEEVQKNAVVICVLIQEQVHEAQPEYHLLFAGFLPTEMIKLRTGKISFGIEQLLYGGGLRCYLEELQSSTDNYHQQNLQIYKPTPKQEVNQTQTNYQVITPSFSPQNVNYSPERDEHLNLLYVKLGDRCFQKGDYQAAITNYNAAVQLKHNDEETYYRRALACNHIGDYKGAIEDCTRAIKINPNNARAYFFRGMVRLQRGNKQGAIDDCTQVININPKYAKAYNQRGLVRCELGDYEGAIEDYTQAIKINSHDGFAYKNRADARSLLGDNQGAIEDYAQAIKINPHLVEDKQLLNQENKILFKDGVDYKNPANTRSDVGNYDGLIESYTQAIKINPNDADAYYNRGNNYYELGNYKGAIEDFQKAADLYWKEGKLGEHKDARERIIELEIEESLDTLNF